MSAAIMMLGLQGGRVLQLYAMLLLRCAAADSCCVRVVPQHMRDVVTRCLQKDPKQRPSATELLQHKFFKVSSCHRRACTTAARGMPHVPPAACTTAAAIARPGCSEATASIPDAPLDRNHHWPAPPADTAMPTCANPTLAAC